MPEDNISPALRQPPRSLGEVRIALAARLQQIGDRNFGVVKADELRQWIATLDAEMAQRQRAA